MRIFVKKKVIFFTLLISIELFYGKLVSYVGNYSKLIIPVIVLNALILALYTFRFTEGTKKKIGYIIFFAYAIRGGILIGKMYGLKTPLSGMDDNTFYNVIIGVYSMSMMRFPTLVKNFVPIIGDNRYVLEYINVVISIITIYVMKNTLLLLHDNDEKKILIPLAIFALNPVFIFISTSFLREPTMVFLNVCSIYFFIKWYKKTNNIYFLLACLMNVASSWFHSGVLFATVAYCIVFLTFNVKTKRVTFHTKSVINIFILATIVIVIFVLFGNSIFQYFDKIESGDDVSTRGAIGSTDYLTFLDNKPFVVTAIFMPLKMLYFFMSPMPWDCRTIETLLTFIFNSCLFLYLFISIIKKPSSDKHLRNIFLVIILSLAICHAAGVKNAGTALRHREKIMAFFIIPYSLIVENDDKKNKSSHKNTKLT